MTNNIQSTPQINPYIAGNPVSGEAMFYGRQDVFDFVRANLEGMQMEFFNETVEDTAAIKKDGGRVYRDEHTGPITNWALALFSLIGQSGTWMESLVVDGAIAAFWLNKVKDVLENFPEDVI